MEQEIRIELPEFCLVLLMGPSGSGKSTFAARHFLPTEVLSSDAMRALVADDASDQSATAEAFEVLHAIAQARLRRMRLTVVDATNVQEHARAPLLELARHHQVQVVVIALDLELEACCARNASRPSRHVPAEAIALQHAQFRHSLGQLRQGRRLRLVELRGEAAIEAARVVRVPLRPNLRQVRGPFDIVGDVHGCLEELVTLLERLGYAPQRDATSGRWTVEPPAGRQLFFVGDLVDRGPQSAEVLRLTMDLWASGAARLVPGNHDAKLARALAGNPVTPGHGLEETLRQVHARGEAFAAEVSAFLAALPPHAVLDEGRLVIAHAGLEEHLQGRDSPRAESFALYGKTNGEQDAYGMPVRLDWMSDYRGAARVVFGHTPVAHARWVNGTIDIDTGCVFGGRLTALRYPELELVSVPAQRLHCPPTRPFLTEDARRGLAATAVTEALAQLGGSGGVETLAEEGFVRVSPHELAQVSEWLASAPRVDVRWWLGCPAPGTVIAVVLRSPVAAAARFGFVRDEAVWGEVYDEALSPVAVSTEGLAQVLAAGGVFESLGSDWVCLAGRLDAQGGLVAQRVLASEAGVTGSFDGAWHARLLGAQAAREALPEGAPVPSSGDERAARIARSVARRRAALLQTALGRFVEGAALAEVVMCVIAQLAIGARGGAP